jgi:regulatory protein
MLGRRELSTAQLRDRLARKGFDAPAVTHAVTRLRDERALDDRRTAAAVARTAAGVKRHGPQRIRRTLEAMGIDRDLARQTVDEAFGEEGADARLLLALARRWHESRGRIPDRATFQRLYAALIRQGFAADRVMAALRTLGRDVAPDSLE